MATPKLRFKEFDGDWTSKQLGKIIGISSASRVLKNNGRILAFHSFVLVM